MKGYLNLVIINLRNFNSNFHLIINTDKPQKIPPLMARPSRPYPPPLGFISHMNFFLFLKKFPLLMAWPLVEELFFCSFPKVDFNHLLFDEGFIKIFQDFFVDGEPVRDSGWSKQSILYCLFFRLNTIYLYIMPLFQTQHNRYIIDI